jgi:diguanylate cyclase
MTAHDPQLHRPFEGIRRWFGLRRDEPGESEAVANLSLLPVMNGDVARQRRELVARIDEILDAHDLPATRLTLGVAHDLVTGVCPDLANSIALRMRSQRPVTLEWLHDLVGEADHGGDEAVIAELVERLEASLGEFTRTAKDARVATTDYGSALARHADQLDAVAVPGAMLSDLTALTKAMLARTREVEAELSRSEKESRALRLRLDQARRSAEEDHLTGLPNRRAFDALYEREFSEAVAAGESICVAFVDVDYFKKINDTHGHDAGDRILKVVAETLARISNDKCHVARHGGEEFVALFRGVGIDAAHHRLDQAREELAGRRLVNRATDVPFGEVTFSGGVADVLGFADRATALRAADVALYRAKQAGRNRIVRANEDDGKLVS